MTYNNKLLNITPYMPGFIVNYLNRPEKERNSLHTALVNTLHFTIKRSVEPAIFLFLISRSLNYNIRLTLRTLLGNWRSALTKLIFNYLGKSDMEYDQKLSFAKQKMPELFNK